MSSVIMPTNGIHETAIIHPSAKIGKDVSVGPYAVIDEDTEIGDGCVIGAHVTIHPYTKIGKNCHFFPGCSIGAVPQDLKFVGEKAIPLSVTAAASVNAALFTVHAVKATKPVSAIIS